MSTPEQETPEPETPEVEPEPETPDTEPETPEGPAPVIGPPDDAEFPDLDVPVSEPVIGPPDEPDEGEGA
jgi:hypothetical protein